MEALRKCLIFNISLQIRPKLIFGLKRRIMSRFIV